MKFEIKRIEIIDDPGLSTNMSKFVQCHVEIGDNGSSGADIFFVDVCNSDWAKDHFESSGEISNSSILVVNDIDEASIRKHIEEKFLTCDYASFDELVKRVAPLMRWEFA